MDVCTRMTKKISSDMISINIQNMRGAHCKCNYREFESISLVSRLRRRLPLISTLESIQMHCWLTHNIRNSWKIQM